jgi:hypothetical protein
MDVFETIILTMKDEFPSYFYLLDFVTISGMKGLSENFMDTLWFILDKPTICSQQPLSICFINKHIDTVDVRILLNNKNIKENHNWVKENSWRVKPKTCKLPKQKFINECFEFVLRYFEKNHNEEFKKIDFITLSKYRTFSESIIDDFANYWNWNNICTNQENVTEFIINKHFDKINFKSISITQASKMSLDFIYKNSKYLNLKSITCNWLSRSVIPRNNVSLDDYFIYAKNKELLYHNANIYDDTSINFITI